MSGALSAGSAPVAVVSGGSGGIGSKTADLLFQRGYAVYDLSRSGVEREGVAHIFCDVADPGSVRAAVKSVAERTGGRIDLLVCNAGMGISGAVEFTGDADAKRLFDVNFFGAYSLIRETVPLMRAQKSGRILTVCSVAAAIAIPFQSFYSASKAALLSLTLALRGELRPFGITAAALLPGDTATGFTGARKKAHAGDECYRGRISRSVARMEKDERTGMSALFAAKKIVRISACRRLKPVYTIGWKYQLFMFLIRILPSAAVSRVVFLLYAK